MCSYVLLLLAPADQFNSKAQTVVGVDVYFEHIQTGQWELIQGPYSRAVGQEAPIIHQTILE